MEKSELFTTRLRRNVILPSIAFSLCSDHTLFQIHPSLRRSHCCIPSAPLLRSYSAHLEMILAKPRIHRISHECNPPEEREENEFLMGSKEEIIHLPFSAPRTPKTSVHECSPPEEAEQNEYPCRPKRTTTTNTNFPGPPRGAMFVYSYSQARLKLGDVGVSEG